MAWIGLVDRAGGRRAAAGPAGGAAAGDPAAPMPRGGLLVEALRPAAAAPVNLLRLSAPEAALTLRLAADEAALFLRRGSRSAAWTLPLPPARPGGALRLALAWEGGRARFSAWCPEAEATAARSGELPGAPLTGAEARRLLDDREGVPLDPALLHLALADHPVPGGPLPGLDPEAPVATPGGDRPAGRLAAGDAVLGPDGAPVRLLWAGTLALPALGGLAPHRLSAPRLALGRGLVAAGEQGLVLEGGDVEYLFGAERVTAAARDLGTALPGPPLRRWTGLATRDGDPVSVGGVAVATLAAGALLADPEAWAASVLAGLPRPPAAGQVGS